jgi:hypothetical protein
MATVIKYVVHYREAPESPQWEEEFYTKGAADEFALRIFLAGGITVIVEGEEESNEPEKKGNQDELNN